MSKEEVMRKIQFGNQRRTAKLKMLFKAEVDQYKKKRRQMLPTDDDLMRELESQVRQIQSAKTEQKSKFNEKMREIQFENNCDELRRDR